MPEALVFADPCKLIPVQNEKYVKSCRELYLGGKGIEKLNDFHRFLDLEVLWLNDNKLNKIEGLECNFRLKDLYLHNNRIGTLKGALRNLRFLEVLLLYNNQLRDLQHTLEDLAHLHSLKHLALFGNPCAEEQNYRLYVIHHIPSLKILDNHEVRDDERGKARALFEGRNKATLAFGQKIDVYEKATVMPLNEPCPLARQLERYADRVRRQREQRERDDVAKLYQTSPAQVQRVAGEALPVPIAMDFLSRRVSELHATSTAPHIVFERDPHKDPTRRPKPHPPSQAPSQSPSAATLDSAAALPIAAPPTADKPPSAAPPIDRPPTATANATAAVAAIPTTSAASGGGTKLNPPSLPAAAAAKERKSASPAWLWKTKCDHFRHPRFVTATSASAPPATASASQSATATSTSPIRTVVGSASRHTGAAFTEKDAQQLHAHNVLLLDAVASHLRDFIASPSTLPHSLPSRRDLSRTSSGPASTLRASLPEPSLASLHPSSQSRKSGGVETSTSRDNQGQHATQSLSPTRTRTAPATNASDLLPAIAAAIVHAAKSFVEHGLTDRAGTALLSAFDIPRTHPRFRLRPNMHRALSEPLASARSFALERLHSLQHAALGAVLGILVDPKSIPSQYPIFALFASDSDPGSDLGGGDVQRQMVDILEKKFTEHGAAAALHRTLVDGVQLHLQTL